MFLRSTASLLLGFATLLTGAVAAHAAPGEATAVLRSCGSANADTIGTSEATGLPQRTLTYGTIRLEFSPATTAAADDNWQFTHGWVGHLPETGNEIARKLPCFGQALETIQAAAADQPLPADPSLAGRAPVPAKRSWSGIQGLWIILFLFGVIAIFGVAIPRRRHMVSRPELSERPFRRPSLQIPRFRRRTRVSGTDQL